MLLEANQSSYEIPRRLWMVHSRCLPSLRRSRHTPTYARTSERTQMLTAGGAKSAYRLLGARLSNGERPTALILSCGVQKKPPLLLSASWRKENIATISGMNLTQYHCHWHTCPHKDDCSLARSGAQQPARPWTQSTRKRLQTRRKRRRRASTDTAPSPPCAPRSLARVPAAHTAATMYCSHPTCLTLSRPRRHRASQNRTLKFHPHTHTRAAACGRHALASAGRCACLCACWCRTPSSASGDTAASSSSGSALRSRFTQRYCSSRRRVREIASTALIASEPAG